MAVKRRLVIGVIENLIQDIYNQSKHRLFAQPTRWLANKAGNYIAELLKPVIK